MSQIFDSYLAAAAVMTGRVVRQKVAVRIVFLKPCRRVICSLRISAAALTFAPYTLLVHVICFIVQSEKRLRIVGCTCIFPLKFVYSVNGYISVFIQNTYGCVIQSGHIPLKSVGNDFVCIKTFYFQFLNLSHLRLESDIKCSIILSVTVSVRAVIGCAKVIGKSQEIKFSVICKSG